MKALGYGLENWKLERGVQTDYGVCARHAFPVINAPSAGSPVLQNIIMYTEAHLYAAELAGGGELSVEDVAEEVATHHGCCGGCWVEASFKGRSVTRCSALSRKNMVSLQ
jgi:hypothetical protein